MVVVMNERATEAQIDSVIQRLIELGMDVHRSSGVTRTVLGVVGAHKIDPELIGILDGVHEVLRISEPYKRASRTFKPEDTVVAIDDTSAANDAVEADAAATDLKGIVLGIQTADCVPILVADSRGAAVAAIHAGWRGTAARIVESTVARFREKFSLEPKDLIAAVGPHIGVCCYEVGQDVVDAIGDPVFFESRPHWAKLHLNLGAANRRQLINAGLHDEQIEVSSLCTRCRGDLFHSYRRDGKKTGHMLSVIGIVP